MGVVYIVSFFFYFLSLIPVSVIFFSPNHLIKQKGELLKFSVFPLAEPKSCRGEERKKKIKEVTIFQEKKRESFPIIACLLL